MPDEPEDEARLRLREERQFAKSIAKWDKEIVSKIMDTPQGRFWMERLLDHCSMFTDAYRDDGDIYTALKRDGKANIGRFISAQIEQHCPNDYMRMMRERRDRLEVLRSKTAAERRAAQPADHFLHSGLTDMEARADAQSRAMEAAVAAATEAAEAQKE